MCRAGRLSGPGRATLRIGRAPDKADQDRRRTEREEQRVLKAGRAPAAGNRGGGREGGG